MALSQAAAAVEKLVGHSGNATTAQDVTNPGRNRAKYGHPTETMQALTWQGKNSVKIMEVPSPVVIEDRDVILRVTGSTVCGSDLHLVHGSVLEMEKGDVLGHEFCGVVESMGAAVKNLSVGDRVVASFQIACGSCMYCQKKISSQCNQTNENTLEKALYGGQTAGMFGYSHLTGGFCGGQCEKVRVPYGDVNLLKLPDSVPDEKGLYLSDVLATSYNAVVDTGVQKGDNVAIWGAGPIGQMAAAFALQVGAARVLLIDSVQWRLDYCKSKLQSVELMNYATLPKGSSVTSRLKELFPPEGPDAAIECVAGEYPKSLLHSAELTLGLETDTSELVNEMITSVRAFGKCGVTGVYVGFTNHFNIGSLMERGVMLKGNGQAPVHLYWEKLLKQIEDGTLEPLQMVTKRVRLEDLEEVYKRFDAREEGMQKVFVQTKWSNPPCAGSPSLTVY